MNQKIDNMITENIQTTKGIVERKTQIGKGTRYSSLVHNAVGKFFEIIPGKLLYVDTRIFYNIAVIIKMPGALKAVIVRQKQYDHEGCGNKQVTLPPV